MAKYFRHTLYRLLNTSNQKEQIYIIVLKHIVL